MSKKKSRTKKYEETLMEFLCQPLEAIEYLRQAANEERTAKLTGRAFPVIGFNTALRRVCKARGIRIVEAALQEHEV